MTSPVVTRDVSKLDATRPTEPLVSAVVLADGFPPQIHPTVVSLLAQTYPHVEVVAVCHPHGRPHVPEPFGGGRVIEVEWPRGATRWEALTAGLDKASGDLVTLQPHGGVMPAVALGAMVASLHQTGSDLVTTTIDTIDGATSVQPTVGSRYALRRCGTTVVGHPALVVDTGWRNKLWRREVVERARVGAQCGGLTGETSVVLGALVEADAIDVLPVVGHLQDAAWVGDLATVAQKLDVDDLAVHVSGLSAVRQGLGGEAHPGVAAVVDRRICEVDLVVTAAVASRSSGFADAVVQAFGPLARSVDPGLPLGWQTRAMTQAAATGDAATMVHWAAKSVGARRGSGKVPVSAGLRNGVKDTVRLVSSGRRDVTLAKPLAGSVAHVMSRLRAAGRRTTRMQVGGVDVGRQAGRVVSMAARVVRHTPGTRVGAVDVPPRGQRLWVGYGTSGLVRPQLHPAASVVDVALDDTHVVVTCGVPGTVEYMELRGVGFGTSVPLAKMVARGSIQWDCEVSSLSGGPDRKWQLFVCVDGR